MDFLNLHELEKLAQEKLPREIFDFYAGGANDEISLNQNRRIFDEMPLHYRVLVDVSKRSMQASILGQTCGAPVVIAPTAFQRMAHPDGELAVSRAASDAGLILTASTFATYPLEDIAGASKAPLWFQLYTHQDRGLTKSLVERAETAGYKALVLAADVPELGRRERDERNRFSLPPGMRVSNFPEINVSSEGGSGLLTFIQGIRDKALSWKDVEWLRSITNMQVLVKGLVRADDALRAVDCGASAVIVSNHGGRQLDTAVAPIKALPRVVEAVQGRVPVLVDGGVRRGTDVIKALALGANAVLIGRPVIWGLALGGQDGAKRVLDLLLAEIDLAMALCGAPTLQDITPDLLTG